MTGVKWVRVDTGFPWNPKVLELVNGENARAGFVYLCGLAYAGGQGNEGWIPAAALPVIHGTMEDADALVDVGFWIPAPGGWTVHDWHAYQASNEEIETRTKRARAAAEARWRRKDTQ